jgi:hypothetical protein
VLYGVSAPAAHSNHFDLSALVEFFCLDHFDGHGVILNLKLMFPEFLISQIF